MPRHSEVKAVIDTSIIHHFMIYYVVNNISTPAPFEENIEMTTFESSTTDKALSSASSDSNFGSMRNVSGGE